MKGFFSLGFLLALGLGSGGYFIGKGIADRNSGNRSISVKGLAERHVPASLAIWTIGFQSSGNDLVELSEKLKKDTKSVIDFLTTKHGFSESDISVQPPSFTDTSLQLRDKDAPPPPFRYNGYQSVLLRTTRVEAIKGTQADLADLIYKDVMLVSRGSPSFSFDKLNDIKPAMIQEATKNARIAAEQFSKDSQTELGKLSYASQGWFQVEDRDDATPEQKIVRVVVEVQYEVE